jgi:acylphosphatase
VIQATITVKGRVQGVGYRANAARHANLLGLRGCIRNLPNGDVEALVEGPEEMVERFIQWCHRGPTAAHVTRVNVEQTEATGEYRSFSIRR